MKDTTQLVVFAFWCIVLLGVPFWWKTTEVYRAHLPLGEIDAWQTRQASMFNLPTTISLFVPASLVSESQLHNITNQLEAKLSTQFQYMPFCISFPFHVQIKSWTPQAITQDKLDALLQQKQNADDLPIGHYKLYLQTSQAAHQANSVDKVNVTIGNNRASFIQLFTMDQDTLVSTINTLVPAIFRAEFESLGEIASCSSDKVDKYNGNSMRTFKYSSRYQITFSLMNNNPQTMAIDWDIRDAAQGYLFPLLNELSDVSNFTVDSQIQNYAPLSQKPHYLERQDKPSYYYFNPDQLPHFVNSADWNLASSISSYPTINFLVYVPEADVTPLRIHDRKGKPLLSNSFLVPRWGGVTIKNPPKSIASKPKYSISKEDLQPIMKIFISQLRSLMGIQDVHISAATLLPPQMNTTFLFSTHTGVTTLEKDNLIRRRIMENTVNAISTLRSLSQLVMEIPNMVVLDHIQSQVRESLLCIQSVRDTLERGDYAEALKHSVDAIELSEKAFFDPTMVSMLYFPDEHKYAIYMPLFVPISVPLCIALIKAFKKWKKGSISP